MRNSSSVPGGTLKTAAHLSRQGHARHWPKGCGNATLEEQFAKLLMLARRVLEQQQSGLNVYSLHAPEVEYIGKGKAHRPYEFGAGLSCDHAQPREERSVRHPCGAATRKSL